MNCLIRGNSLDIIMCQFFNVRADGLVSYFSFAINHRYDLQTSSMEMRYNEMRSHRETVFTVYSQQ